MIEYSSLYTELGNEIINKLPEFQDILESNCRIGFMKSSIAKQSCGFYVHAECKRLTGDINMRFIPHDYLIIVYEPNIEHMNLHQIRILLWHELKHIKITNKGDTWKFGINDHDIADFRDLINKVGPRWDEEGAAVPDILTGDMPNE